MELLRTREVSINFGGLWAVDGVDFSIGEGEIAGLIGPNGSGKTTFFNLISGIYAPTRGSIHFKGRDISRKGPHEVRNLGIARTFQSSRLCWNLSVVDNVLTGLLARQVTTWWKAILSPSSSNQELREGYEKSLEYLRYFNEDLVARRYDLVKNIPHIDRRRIEICRALVSEPKLLLLDEPSAGLNPEETLKMMDDIRRIREQDRNISIIIIEHDMAVIRQVSDRVVALNAGRKIAEGSFSEVAGNEEVVRAYLGEEAAAC